MKQLKQEQQFNHAEDIKLSKDEIKGTVTIHNPNSREETAKYLAKLVIQELEQRDRGDGL